MSINISNHIHTPHTTHHTPHTTHHTPHTTHHTPHHKKTLSSRLPNAPHTHTTKDEKEKKSFVTPVMPFIA